MRKLLPIIILLLSTQWILEQPLCQAIRENILDKELPEFYIENDNHVCDGGYYFDYSKKGFHFLVRNEVIASDKDLINRIHSHAILHNQVMSEEIKRLYGNFNGMAASHQNS